MLHHLKDSRWMRLGITYKEGWHSDTPDLLFIIIIINVFWLLWGWSPDHAHHTVVWLVNADPKKSRGLNTNSRIIPTKVNKRSICSHACRFRPSFQPFCWQASIHSFVLLPLRTSVLLPKIVFSFPFARRRPSPPLHQPSTLSLKARQTTAFWCPLYSRLISPVSTHHRRARLSDEAAGMARERQRERNQTKFHVLHQKLLLAHPYYFITLLLRFWLSYWLLNHPNIQYYSSIYKFSIHLMVSHRTWDSNALLKCKQFLTNQLVFYVVSRWPWQH